MTPPRMIIPGSILYLTVRAINRSFRFVPTPKIRKAIRYALAVVSQQYRERGALVLHEFLFMSNHYHLLVTDIEGCVSDFMRDLNSVLTRELNAIRGMNGKAIEPNFGFVRIADDERVIEHSVYTGANPVAAFLVAKARHWRGVSSVGMRYGVAEVVDKPKLGMWSGKNAHAGRAASRRSGRAAYAGRSKLPETAELVIVRPAVRLDLDADELRDLVEARLTEREEKLGEERIRRGIRVHGRKRSESVHFLALPRPEEMFGRTPSVSASSAADRIAMLRERALFMQAYAAARDAFCRGQRDVVFPYGTWLMRVRFGVRCEPPRV